MNGATASCSVGVIVTITPDRAVLKPTQIDALAQAHLDGQATDAEVRFLETNQDAWVGSLWRLLDRAEEALASARASVKGAARVHVLSDLDEDCFRIDAQLTALTGPPRDDELLSLEDTRDVEPEPRAPYVGTVQLQLSRTDGRIVAWAAGHNLRGEYYPVHSRYSQFSIFCDLSFSNSLNKSKSLGGPIW